MKTPWHFWLIAILSLLWNAMGAFDYSATQLRWSPYMSNFTPEQLEYFQSFPIWVVACWAIAVWFAVIGSLLMLFRSRLSVPLFIISLICIVATAVHNFILADVTMTDLMGTEAAIFSAAILLVGAFLAVYARRMAERGVLR